MTEGKCLIVHVKNTYGHGSFMRMHEVAYRCGIHPDLLDRLVRLGLIDYEERRPDGELVFRDEVVPAVRRILRLRNELGVNYVGVGVILELMARIDSLEQRIMELEDRLFPGDG